MINIKKILILFENTDISCLSAKNILENIDRTLYNIISACISKDNNWYIFNDNLQYLTNNTKIDNIIDFLKQFDKVFPITQNFNIKELFNLYNIDYIGTKLPIYDKEITKIICNNNHINQVPYLIIKDNKPLKNIDLKFPVIIKSSKYHSSINNNIANNIKELNKYIKLAFNHDNKIIIEKFIKSRILECAILENKKLKASSVGEIKYINFKTENKKIIIPAKITPELKKEIQQTSIKIFKTLELKDLAIINFLYDYNEDILYFNEVNDIPEFANTSMYPMLLKEDGINTRKLITKLIEN